MFLVESLRFNQANLKDDEFYNYSALNYPDLLAAQYSGGIYTSVPTTREAQQSCSYIHSNYEPRHQSQSRHNNRHSKPTGAADHFYNQSSAALDLLFGIGSHNNNRNTPAMEIELKNLKNPELVYNDHSQASSSYLQQNVDFNRTNTNTSSSSTYNNSNNNNNTNNLENNTNNNPYNNINNNNESKTDDNENNINTSNNNSLVSDLNNNSTTNNSNNNNTNTTNKNTWIKCIVQYNDIFINKLKSIFTDRDDEIFYESVRIQPFSSGSYLRAMLVAGFFNLFYCTYNLLTWPTTQQQFLNQTINNYSHTHYNSNNNSYFFNTLLYGIQILLYSCLFFQIILNIIQLPLRLYIHLMCWESSKAIEVDTAILLIRDLIHSKIWLFNRIFGRLIDACSILTLVLCETFMYLTFSENPYITSLCATNLLTIIVRIIISCLFSISMHDPNVIIDAKRRGLNKWDLDELPTFVFANADEVSNKECSICLGCFDIGEMLISLPCNEKHSFHAECIRNWLQRQNSCPLCQKLI
jgi:hypothetical protein